MTADLDQAEPKPAPSQLAVARVQTPDGERLAVQLAIFINADQARALAAQLSEQAGSMSAAGLVTAAGLGHALAQDL